MTTLLALLLSAFTVIQNGAQKIRKEFTFDNLEPAIVAAEPIGDQHIVFKDAAGVPVKYYHTVTDSWCDAEKMQPKAHFTPLAWTVVAVYFLIIVVMGWYFGHREKDSASFFKGGGKIPWYVAGVSIFATMLSSVTFLAVPALSYISDSRLLQNIIVGYIVVTPLAVFFYMPVFRRMNLTSAYEYLERRFNVGTRLFSSGVFIVFMVLRVAIVTLLPAIAIDAVTGMGIDLAIALCGVVTILYCTFGGLEAVIWSDFIQGIVLIGGAVAILVFLVQGTDGGWTGYLSLAGAAGKLRVFDFSPEITNLTFWVAGTLGITQCLFSYTSDQCVVQRYISVKDEKAAARSMWTNCALGILVAALFFLIGAALWTHYKCHPEMLDPNLPRPDAILPHFMGMELPPVVAGLVIAAVFAATISTLSANLSAASSAITTDFFARFKTSLTDRGRVRIGQWCVVICGIIGTAAAFLLAHMDLRSLCELFQEAISTVTAGVAGVFFLGVFTKRVGGFAALSGLVVNYVVCFGLKAAISTSTSLSTSLPTFIAHIHPFMVGGFGLVSCILTALVLSLFFPKR